MHSSPLFKLSSSSFECCICNSVVISEEFWWRDVFQAWKSLVSLQCTSFEKMLANLRAPAYLFVLSLDHSALSLLPLVSARCSMAHPQRHFLLFSHALVGCLAVILSYCSLSVWYADQSFAGHGQHRNKLQRFLTIALWQALLNLCWGCFKQISTFAKAS